MKQVSLPKETIKELSRVTKAISNAANEFDKASEALAKFSKALPIKEPKWFEFWKWDCFKFEPIDRNGIDYYQPTVDNLDMNNPPRGDNTTIENVDSILKEKNKKLNKLKNK